MELTSTSGNIGAATSKTYTLGGRFDFLCFLLGEGEGGVRGAGRGDGDRVFLLKIPGGGGAFQDGRGWVAGRVSVANLGNFFGGGGAIFVFGAEMSTKYERSCREL